MLTYPDSSKSIKILRTERSVIPISWARSRIRRLGSLLSATNTCPVLQADLAHIQVQQNIDVRKISAWVALASGPTMLAGIYGMNFRHMPELGYRYGYYIVLGVMATLTGVLFRNFKKSDWL